MIEQQQTQVFFAPTARRRFLTRRAAINAEARAIIKEHFPSHRGGWVGPQAWDYEPGWSLEANEPERFARYYRLLTAVLKKEQP